MGQSFGVSLPSHGLWNSTSMPVFLRWYKLNVTVRRLQHSTFTIQLLLNHFHTEISNRILMSRINVHFPLLKNMFSDFDMITYVHLQKICWFTQNCSTFQPTKNPVETKGYLTILKLNLAQIKCNNKYFVMFYHCTLLRKVFYLVCRVMKLNTGLSSQLLPLLQVHLSLLSFTVPLQAGGEGREGFQSC